jgi:hypothetical protein
VVVENALDESGQTSVLAKLSGDQWELNVMARKPEFLALEGIRSMDWDSRRTAKVGVSAGAGVFWCSDGEVATIMVGQTGGSSAVVTSPTR